MLQTPKLNVEVGQKVRVLSGPFINRVGVVDHVSQEKSELTVLVEMFGRETPTELNFDEVEPL